MTVTGRYYCEGRLEESDFDPARVSDLLQQPGAMVWLDVEMPTKETMEMLGAEFGFHELAIEDCLHPHQRPKIEQYGDYFFLVTYAVTVRDGRMVHHEMAAFVSHNYLVTVRKDAGWDLGPVLERWDVDSDLAREGGGFLLYILLDEVVDGYFGCLDLYEDRAEDVEERVTADRAEPGAQMEIFELKKELIQFRRAVAPLRDVLDVLQRRTVEVVTGKLEPYYRDVYDHVLRATDFIDSTRELLSSALDAYLSTVSNRLNVVMKQLTAWAGIVLVPTLIAGVYGMNYRLWPPNESSWGFWFAIGLMVAAGLLLYRAFRKRDWL